MNKFEFPVSQRTTLNNWSSTRSNKSHLYQSLISVNLNIVFDKKKMHHLWRYEKYKVEANITNLFLKVQVIFKMKLFIIGNFNSILVLMPKTVFKFWVPTTLCQAVKIESIKIPPCGSWKGWQARCIQFVYQLWNFISPSCNFLGILGWYH